MISNAGQRPTPQDQPEACQDRNESIDGKSTPEQVKRFAAHVKESLEDQRVHGLEEKGPSLSG